MRVVHTICGGIAEEIGRFPFMLACAHLFKVDGGVENHHSAMVKGKGSSKRDTTPDQCAKYAFGRLHNIWRKGAIGSFEAGSTRRQLAEWYRFVAELGKLCDQRRRNSLHGQGEYEVHRMPNKRLENGNTIFSHILKRLR